MFLHFFFLYLLNKLNLRKELFISYFNRFCWWDAHILDQCGTHMPDFWLPAFAPLCLRALFLLSQPTLPMPTNVRGTMTHQPKIMGIVVEHLTPSCFLCALCYLPGPKRDWATVVHSYNFPLSSLHCLNFLLPDQHCQTNNLHFNPWLQVCFYEIPN